MESYRERFELAVQEIESLTRANEEVRHLESALEQNRSEKAKLYENLTNLQSIVELESQIAVLLRERDKANEHSPDTPSSSGINQSAPTEHVAVQIELEGNHEKCRDKPTSDRPAKSREKNCGGISFSSELELLWRNLSKWWGTLPRC
ncbi:hypothetical protein OESDEN_18045 [Oesophagostomum dentatum]|uniref:Uncharacterized protein n=1 Tax=Oesophagostomum dentatum TaxID=61180 RepID=A0A0B1SAD9_OESDE|nr:hypothetical protein OESDEN_18045 [Oesophagostomum dentatum]